MSRPSTWKRVIDAIESGKLCELDDHSACRRCIPITPLHVVALTGDRDAALRILHDGGNVCFTNGSGTLPIHLAAYKGHSELVRELMCWGWPSPIGRVIWPGRRGYKSGALITALRIAGARKHVDTCKAIIGGMMAYERAIGRDLLNLSDRAREGDVALVDIILSNGHDMLPPPTLAMALRGAIEGNHPSIMEALLQHDAPLHLHRKGEPSAFTVACDLERVELLEVMSVYGVRMDLEEEGETPLTRACRLGNAMTAKYLLENAAPPKKEIKACFARACKVGCTAVAEQLCRTGMFSSEELKKGASSAARHGSEELKSACLQWSDDRSWEEQLQGVFRVMWLCKETDESVLSALPNEMMWELNDWVGGGLSEEDAAREAANFQAKRTLKGRLRKLLKR